MDHIDEFQSPNFHYVAQKCFAGLLLLALVALAGRKREGNGVGVSQGLMLLFAVYSGLYAARNVPVSSLLLILITGPWLSQAMERLAESRSSTVHGRGVRAGEFLRRMTAIDLGLRGHLWPLAAIVLTCWIAGHGGRFGSEMAVDAHFDAKRFPVAAVDYLGKNDVRGSIFSPDDWGGYLIYRLYPRAKVVVDDRHDFYGEQFLKSYLKLLHGQPGWEEFLREHPADYVLVPKGSTVANLLGETAGWKPIYSDDVAVTFVRVGGERLQDPAH
jgi:hypothetical protein